MNTLIIGDDDVAQELSLLRKQRGDRVTMTTQQRDQLSALSKYAQRAVLIKGNDPDELVPLISENDLLVISHETTAPETAALFRTLALEMDQPKKLIYLSSVAIYGDHHGQWVDEKSATLSKHDTSLSLIEAEKIYTSLDEIGWHVCAFRAAEIYGPARTLSSRIRHLEGHILPGDGSQYTNMVHALDVAAAIDYAYRHHLEGIYNLSDDEHPTRKELYDAVCRKHHLPPLPWNPSHAPLHAGNKRISNHKIKAEGFAFRFPHRLLD